MDGSAVGLLAKGLGIGLAVAVPVGPVGLLCIQRTLRWGFAMGLASGLGVALADAGYGAIAAFGLTALMTLLLDHEEALRLAGGLALLVLGGRILWRLRIRQAQPPGGAAAAPDTLTGPMALKAFASCFLVTLTNPTTILSFLAIFAGLGLVGANEQSGIPTPGVWLVLGVFSGSALWWLLLSTLVAGLARRPSPAVLRVLEGASGLAILGFGVLALAGLAAGEP